MDWVRIHAAINEAPAVGIGIGTALLIISAVLGGRRLQKAAFDCLLSRPELRFLCLLAVDRLKPRWNMRQGFRPSWLRNIGMPHDLPSLSPFSWVLLELGAEVHSRRACAFANIYARLLLACAAAVASNGWAVYSGIRVQGAEIREQYLPQSGPDLD